MEEKYPGEGESDDFYKMRQQVTSVPLILHKHVIVNSPTQVMDLKDMDILHQFLVR